jgi:hypothetical protein
MNCTKTNREQAKIDFTFRANQKQLSCSSGVHHSMEDAEKTS